MIENKRPFYIGEDIPVQWHFEGPMKWESKPWIGFGEIAFKADEGASKKTLKREGLLHSQKNKEARINMSEIRVYVIRED